MGLFSVRLHSEYSMRGAAKRMTNLPGRLQSAATAATNDARIVAVLLVVAAIALAGEMAASPLLPQRFTVPASRFTHPSTRMRQLLDTEPFLFGPGVYDPMGAELVMYHGFKTVYFSGYSFAIGHLGTTDMDLYSNVEIADAARRTVSALRKFQLTMAVGDPEKGVARSEEHTSEL